MKFSLLPEEEQSRLLKEVWNAGQEYLAMFGLDEHEKEEILQEVMIVIWRRYETLQDPQKFLAWVKTVLRHETGRFFKRKKRDREHLISFHEPMAEEETLPPLISEKLVYEEMEDFEDSEIYQLVQRLGYPSSTILQLHYQDKETLEEIAQALHIKPSTVRSIARRSREKLKKMILEEAEKKGGKR